MPLKMSAEKLNMMKALGAIIYRTSNEAAWNDTDSHIALAMRLQKAIPHAHILDQ
jgi:cystathionine beta-synthase